MEILAIDDEKIALEELVDSIRQAEPSAVVHSFMSAQEALGAFTEYPCQVAFVDIQMEMISGVEFAKQLKLIYPRVNIIFATGHVNYREDAFDMHASGYITKPITAGKVRKELDDLRYPVSHVSEKKMRIQTFGNFEVYADEEPPEFHIRQNKGNVCLPCGPQGRILLKPRDNGSAVAGRLPYELSEQPEKRP